MSSVVQVVPGGSVTSPQGFLAGATYAGLKTYREDKLDLGLLYSEHPCTAAGTFTTNKIRSPSVDLSEKHLKRGNARAIVANSGIANACVGEQGMKDAQEAVDLAARYLKLPREEVLFCSTGLIGVELPMALLRASIGRVQLTRDGGNALARAIITTDTRVKEVAVSYQAGGRTATVGGIAKGSGMIHPQMATMLAFLSTDAPVELSFLRQSLQEVVDETFNMITVDGDMSTNDSVILLANGQAGGPLVRQGTAEAEGYLEALRVVCTHLAREIARDGEGASKLIEVTVRGARAEEEARCAARAIAASSLVKTAVHGSDPNWGRLMAALGASSVQVEENKVALYINGVCIVEEGRPIPFYRDAIVATMRGPDVRFQVDLNLGESSATAWGCDLSEGYVTFNSAYTT